MGGGHEAFKLGVPVDAFLACFKPWVLDCSTARDEREWDTASKPAGKPAKAKAPKAPKATKATKAKKTKAPAAKADAKATKAAQPQQKVSEAKVKKPKATKKPKFVKPEVPKPEDLDKDLDSYMAAAPDPTLVA